MGLNMSMRIFGQTEIGSKSNDVMSSFVLSLMMRLSCCCGRCDPHHNQHHLGHPISQHATTLTENAARRRFRDGRRWTKGERVSDTGHLWFTMD